jgi:Flp pilus assembly protein TadG
MPLVVSVMFGTIELGRLVATRTMLSFATIQGGRAAGTSGTASYTVVQDTVINSAPMLGLTYTDVDVQVAGGPVNDSASFNARAVGSLVTVTVRYTFKPIVPLSGLLMSNRSWNDSNTASVE